MHLFFYHWTVILLPYLGYCKKKCCNVMAEVILHSLKIQKYFPLIKLRLST